MVFAEREATVPPAGPVADRIAVGVARRRHRARALTSGVAVALLLGAVPVAVSGWRRAAPPATPDAASAAATGTPASRARLVPAPPVAVTVPVSPGWLPGGLSPAAGPTFAEANVRVGRRALRYAASPSGPVEVELIALARPSESETRPGAPEEATARERRNVRVRGHAATEDVSTIRSTALRACLLSWQERSDTWLVVHVVEQTADARLDCGIARRVAEGLVARPLEIPRPLRFGLVPRGLTLALTGLQGDVWCDARDPSGSNWQCLTIGPGEPDADLTTGTKITVHGHEGRIRRDRRSIDVAVPGFLGMSVPVYLHLSDAEIVRIAESAILPRPW